MYRKVFKEKNQTEKDLSLKFIKRIMGIKDTVKEWARKQWDYYVKNPIAKKTEELEGQASQKWNE